MPATSCDFRQTRAVGRVRLSQWLGVRPISGRAKMGRKDSSSPRCCTNTSPREWSRAPHFKDEENGGMDAPSRTSKDPAVATYTSSSRRIDEAPPHRCTISTKTITDDIWTSAQGQPSDARRDGRSWLLQRWMTVRLLGVRLSTLPQSHCSVNSAECLRSLLYDQSSSGHPVSHSPPSASHSRRLHRLGCFAALLRSNLLRRLVSFADWCLLGVLWWMHTHFFF